MTKCTANLFFFAKKGLRKTLKIAEVSTLKMQYYLPWGVEEIFSSSSILISDFFPFLVDFLASLPLLEACFLSVLVFFWGLVLLDLSFCAFESPWSLLPDESTATFPSPSMSFPWVLFSSTFVCGRFFCRK